MPTKSKMKPTAKRQAKKSGVSTAMGMPMAATPGKMTRSQKAQELKWRAEEDLRTMQRAEEIKSDKGRIAAMKRCAEEQLKAAQDATKKVAAIK